MRALPLLLPWLCGCAAPQFGVRAAPAADPAQAEVPLPGAAPPWQASLVLDNGRTGVWTVKALDAFPQYAAPEVVALDDAGTCWILVSYSGKWTPFPVLKDGSWLGGLGFGDADPRVPGREIYVGSRSGHLYQVRTHPNGLVDGRFVGEVPGREIHTLVALDAESGFAERGVLAFTNPGGLYLMTPSAPHGEWEIRALGDLPGRVRDAEVLPRARTGDAPAIATVGREGALRLLRLRDGAPEFETVFECGQGLGRLAIGAAGGAELVLYSTADDGRVFRHARGAGGSWSHETIHRGAQGLRGVAAGRFDPDPAVETVACFGYDSNVVLLSRSPGAAWSARNLYADRDRGHWLARAELDGRNDTDELLLCGYGARIVLLSRR